MITLEHFFNRIDGIIDKQSSKNAIFKSKNTPTLRASNLYRSYKQAKEAGLIPNINVMEHLAQYVTNDEYKELLNNYESMNDRPQSAIAYKGDTEDICQYYDDIKKVTKRKALANFLLDEEIITCPNEAKELQQSFRRTKLQKRPPSFRVLMALSDYVTKEQIAIMIQESIKRDIWDKQLKTKADLDITMNLLRYLPQEYREKERRRRKHERDCGLLR